VLAVCYTSILAACYALRLASLLYFEAGFSCCPLMQASLQCCYTGFYTLLTSLLCFYTGFSTMLPCRLLCYTSMQTSPLCSSAATLPCRLHRYTVTQASLLHCYACFTGTTEFRSTFPPIKLSHKLEKDLPLAF
jgi:hypothetical protein